MTDFYVKNGSPVGTGTGLAEWATGTAYVIGDRVVCRQAYGTSRRFYVYECTTGGTSHGSTEPTWPTSGTVNDNGVVWTCRNPTSWANANLYFHYLMGDTFGTTMSAGDNIWIKSDHDEAWTLGATNLNFGHFRANSTLANPISVMSTSDTAHEPPQSVTAGAKIRTNGSIEFYFVGGYYYGLELYAGYNASSGTPIFRTHDDGGSVCNHGVFENCLFKLAYASSAPYFSFGQFQVSWNRNTLLYINCTFEFTHAGQSMLLRNGCVAFWGGAVQGTAPTNLFVFENRNKSVHMEAIGMDLSLVESNLFGSSELYYQKALVSRCKLNANVTIFAGAPAQAGNDVQVECCDSGNKNYKIARTDYAGTLVDEIVYVRTGGASDGTTPISWKIVTNANANSVAAVRSPWISVWNETTGSSKTLTIEVLHDSATGLKDSEIWVEVMALTDANFPLAESFADNVALGLVGADQATSSVTWYTTGMTNPNKQKLSVTFTPQMKGVVSARVCFGKANYTVYVDPMAVIS